MSTTPCANCGKPYIGADLNYQGQNGSYCSMDCLGQAEKGGGSGKTDPLQLSDQVGYDPGLDGNNPGGDAGQDGQLYTDPATLPDFKQQSDSVQGYPNSLD